MIRWKGNVFVCFDLLLSVVANAPNKSMYLPLYRFLGHGPISNYCQFSIWNFVRDLIEKDKSFFTALDNILRATIPFLNWLPEICASHRHDEQFVFPMPLFPLYLCTCDICYLQFIRIQYRQLAGKRYAELSILKIKFKRDIESWNPKLYFRRAPFDVSIWQRRKKKWLIETWVCVGRKRYIFSFLQGNKNDVFSFFL